MAMNPDWENYASGALCELFFLLEKGSNRDIFHFDILTGYVYKESTCEVNIWEN